MTNPSDDFIDDLHQVLREEYHRDPKWVRNPFEKNCLLVSLAARDILQQVGFPKAKILFATLYVIPDDGNVMPVEVGTEGLPPMSPRHIACHTVVTCGDRLYDPTFAQAWRPRFGPAPCAYINRQVPDTQCFDDIESPFGWHVFVEDKGFSIMYLPHRDQTRWLAPSASTSKLRRQPVVKRAVHRLVKSIAAAA